MRKLDVKCCFNAIFGETLAVDNNDKHVLNYHFKPVVLYEIERTETQTHADFHKSNSSIFYGKRYSPLPLGVAERGSGK